MSQPVSRVLAAAEAAARAAEASADLCQRLGSMSADHRRRVEGLLAVQDDRLNELQRRLLALES